MALRFKIFILWPFIEKTCVRPKEHNLTSFLKAHQALCGQALPPPPALFLAPLSPLLHDSVVLLLSKVQHCLRAFAPAVSSMLIDLTITWLTPSFNSGLMKTSYPLSDLLFFFKDFFESLYWICYNIHSVLCFGFLAARQVGSQLPTRDRTCNACPGRWSLNHWTSREVPEWPF